MNLQPIFDSMPAENPKEMQPLQGLKQGFSLRFCDRGSKSVNLQPVFDSIPAEILRKYSKCKGSAWLLVEILRWGGQNT